MPQYYTLSTLPHTPSEHKQCTLLLALLGRSGEEIILGFVLVMDIVLWGCGLELLPFVQVGNVPIIIIFHALILNNSDQSVFLSRQGITYTANNSNILVTRIGSTDDSALTCHTKSTACCTQGSGEWLFPSGERIDENRNGFSLTRRYQVVSLYRHGDIQTPLGRYCCRIPNGQGSMASICANLIGELINTVSMH